MFALLEQCAAFSEATEGAFDITVGPLLRCWGFRDEAGCIPSPDAHAAARERVGMRHLLLDADRSSVRFARPGMALDPGAVGKGYALECAAEVLREAGVGAALLHAGTSSVIALGTPEGEEAWPVAIADPRAPGAILTVKRLRDTALSVSGGHGRYFEVDGRRYGHVIDPRTGAPTTGPLLAAVIHPSAVIAEALSTALLVAGEMLLPRLRARWPEAETIISSPASDGKPQMNTHKRQ